MAEKIKIGIIICDRYRRCAGGKCLRALRDKEGAFSRYGQAELELVGYTTCDGCPGGNVEYAGNEMVLNGATAIHLATGLIVGYPPCPYLKTFVEFLENRFPVQVVVGTHPIPPLYLKTHTDLGTFQDPDLLSWLEPVLSDPAIREKYA